jgi:NAD(P)-dependent dehydrogenase (short-subunit alcohol dehydrogenase family)
MNGQGKAARLSLEPPKQWGFTDEELATHSLPFRPDLFKDQVFLISGGGSGMGKAMAYLFVRLGAKVAVCGRRAEKLAETADGIRRHLGAEVMTQAMTIRDPGQVDALVAAVYERYGRLDSVVNNGGGQFPQAALDFSVKGWNAVIDTNLNGTWYMMQAAAREWAKRQLPGNIVNIVAVVNRGMPQVAHTCAARAGVIYLSKTLSTEWAPLKIRVNCVAPGSVETEGFNVYPRAAAEAFRSSNPMMTLGDVFDIGNAVAYLSSPETGKFITGELLAVDGGRQQWGEDWPGGIPDYFRRADR